MELLMLVRLRHVNLFNRHHHHPLYFYRLNSFIFKSDLFIENNFFFSSFFQINENMSLSLGVYFFQIKNSSNSIKISLHDFPFELV